MREVSRESRARHDQLEAIDVRRLDQVVVSAELDRAHRRLHVVARGEDHDRRRLRLLVERAQDLEPVELGQAEIEEHEVGAAGGVERLPAVSGGRDLVALAGEELLERPADGTVVVDHEHAGGHGWPPYTPRAVAQAKEIDGLRGGSAGMDVTKHYTTGTVCALLTARTMRSRRPRSNGLPMTATTPCCAASWRAGSAESTSTGTLA